MAQHEMEITICRNGQIKVHIKGVKGKACLEYAQWLKQVVGKVSQQQQTSEFYEPDIKSRINLEADLRIDSEQQ